MPRINLNSSNSFRSLLFLGFLLTVLVLGGAGLSALLSSFGIPRSASDPLALAVVQGNAQQVIESRKAFESRCIPLLAVLGQQRASPKQEKLPARAERESEIVLTCSSLARTYVEDLDVLIKKHASLLDDKVAEKRRDDSVSAIMALLALIVAVVTLWLGLGATALERIKSEAKRSLDFSRKMASAYSLRLAASHELFTLILEKYGPRTAANSVGPISLHLELLMSKDGDLVRSARTFLSDYWMSSEGLRFPAGKRYISMCNGLYSEGERVNVEFFPR